MSTDHALAFIGGILGGALAYLAHRALERAAITYYARKAATT